MTTRKKREKQTKEQNRAEKTTTKRAGNRESDIPPPEAGANFRPISTVARFDEVEWRIVRDDGPATAQLLRALALRLDRLLIVLSPLDSKALHHVRRDIVEICSWIIPPHSESAETPGEFDFYTDMIRRGVLTFRQATEAASLDETKVSGRPINDTRSKALRARNIQLQLEGSGEELTLPQLAMRVKYCEDEQPPVSLGQCGDRLRKQIDELKSFLRRLSSGENS